MSTFTHRTTPLYVVGLGGTQQPNSTSFWALVRALEAAQAAGAQTELLSMRELKLPLYEPGRLLETYNSPGLTHLLEAVRRADAMIWSTAGYQGALASATKNALHFLDFLRNDSPPYLEGKVVGLISTAGGELAAVNAVNALDQAAHALRATVVSLFIAIPRATRFFDAEGRMTDTYWAGRLDQLGRLVVDLALKNQPISTEI